MLLILVGKTCSELYPLILVNDGVRRSCVVNPRRANFKAIVRIELRVSLWDARLRKVNISFASRRSL